MSNYGYNYGYTPSEPTQAERERQLWLDQGLKKLHDEMAQQRCKEECMSDTIQHTAIPWEVKNQGISEHQIYIEPVTPTEIDCFVCDLQADRTDTPKKRARILATAKFIVRACNAHEDYDHAAHLVAACAMPDMAGKVLISVEAFQAINAAIAKANKS